MNIPYTVERRADTGVTNVTMGIWLFLASEVMLFGALFSAYALLRASAASWPHGADVLNRGFGLANTAVLLALSAMVARGSRRPAVEASRWLGLASVLAMAFLAIKTVEYRDEIARGLVPATNTFLATYFTLTGLHAVHVIGGVIANLWAMLGRSRVGDAMTTGRMRALARYWLFVDVVWLLILGLVYFS